MPLGLAQCACYDDAEDHKRDETSHEGEGDHSTAMLLVLASHSCCCHCIALFTVHMWLGSEDTSDGLCKRLRLRRSRSGRLGITVFMRMELYIVLWDCVVLIVMLITTIPFAKSSNVRLTIPFEVELDWPLYP